MIICRVVSLPKRFRRHIATAEVTELHFRASRLEYESVTRQQVVLQQQDILSGIYFLPNYVKLRVFTFTLVPSVIPTEYLGTS